MVVARQWFLWFLCVAGFRWTLRWGGDVHLPRNPYTKNRHQAEEKCQEQMPGGGKMPRTDAGPPEKFKNRCRDPFPDKSGATQFISESHDPWWPNMRPPRPTCVRQWGVHIQAGPNLFLVAVRSSFLPPIWSPPRVAGNRSGICSWHLFLARWHGFPHASICSCSIAFSVAFGGWVVLHIGSGGHQLCMPHALGCGVR